MTYNVLMGALNPTHSLTHAGNGVVWERRVGLDLHKTFLL